MKETPNPPRVMEAPPDVLYRFQVQDSKTGETYYVLVGEDGMAYREMASEPLRKAG